MTSVLCCLALGLGSAKYLYIHDETVWTKQSWDALKLKFPLEKLLQEDELAGFESISSKGAFSVATLQEGLEANKAHRHDIYMKECIRASHRLSDAYAVSYSDHAFSYCCAGRTHSSKTPSKRSLSWELWQV